MATYAGFWWPASEYSQPQNGAFFPLTENLQAGPSSGATFAGSTVTINTTGVYRVSFVSGFLGGASNAEAFTYAVFVNGVKAPDLTGTFFQTPETGSVSYEGKWVVDGNHSFNSGDLITIQFAATGTGTDVDFTLDGQFSVTLLD